MSPLFADGIIVTVTAVDVASTRAISGLDGASARTHTGESMHVLTISKNKEPNGQTRRNGRIYA